MPRLLRNWLTLIQRRREGQKFGAIALCSSGISKEERHNELSYSFRMAVVCTICHKATTVSSDGGSKARSHYRGVDSTGGATIALEKADYFAKEGLWSDALQELYSVSKSSAELTRAIAQIQAHDFYAQDSAS
jgi:hypothetical protein